MGKFIAVDGCQLVFQTGGPPTAITINPGQLSNHVKYDGKKVYTSLNFTISGYIGGAIASGGTGSGSIVSTSVNNKVDGKKVFLEGDMSAAITITGTSASGYPAVAVDVVKIQSAGQNKGKGT